MVALVCVTEDRRAARATSQAVADAFDRIGIDTPIRLWAIADRWTDLNSGESGPRSTEASTRMAAGAAFHGQPPPAASRAALADALIADPTPVAAVLDEARAFMQQRPPGEQHAWAVNRLAQFHQDGRSLSNPEAARMLVALESKPTRDVLWTDMSRGNAARHIELWSDLTRRAPDEVRTPAASMLAFSHWLHGEGAQAWLALGRIPPSAHHYTMAAMTATLLERGVHPSVWEDTKATLVDSEAFVPDRPDQVQQPVQSAGLGQLGSGLVSRHLRPSGTTSSSTARPRPVNRRHIRLVSLSGHSGHLRPSSGPTAYTDHLTPPPTGRST